MFKSNFVCKGYNISFRVTSLCIPQESRQQHHEGKAEMGSGNELQTLSRCKGSRHSSKNQRRVNKDKKEGTQAEQVVQWKKQPTYWNAE